MTLVKWNRFVIAIIVFIFFFFIGFNQAVSITQASYPIQQVDEPSDTVDEAVLAAFQEAFQQNRAQVLGFQIFAPVVDHIQYSQDQRTALLWIAFRDPETGEVIETEPGLSIAHSADPDRLTSADNWSITMQSDSSWGSELSALPAELLNEDIRDRLLETLPENYVYPAAVLAGYKLPWTAGLAKRVTNSIGHVYEVNGGLTSCPATCRYAYDFADGTMFPLLASKGGTVKAVKWSCPNFGTDCTNFLVLEDQSTVPTSYQLYYHMAYNSVPQRLRTVGAQVLQGEYIGDADDTGYSTGHHLHYHVYTSPNRSDWSWGYSVDFKYDDVTTNGGYPRTCAEASAYPSLGSQCMVNNLYTSGNKPAHPPTATLTAPADRQMITTRTVRVAGSASDDIQIVRIQVLANYSGEWKTIDDIQPTGNGPFQKDVDLCTAGVPDGPFGLTVRVYDREGSQASNMPVRQLIKTASCTSPVQPPPAPACTPNANQIALYADTDFRGACTKFDVNASSGYTADKLGALGNNNAASIQVGSDVMAVLFDRDSDVAAAKVTGRMETIQASDAGLADNLIGLDTVSGLWVLSRSTAPKEPFINAFSNQLTAGASPTSLDSLVLAWEGGIAATSYEVSLSGPGQEWTRTVTGATSLSVGSLDPGAFTMTVLSRNSAGTKSATKTFTVTPAAFPAASTRTAPYQESLENGPADWVATGLWRHGSIEIGGRASTKAWIYNDGSDYVDPTWRAGDLTSPPISVPASGPYYLRFSYYADVEDGNPYWDQRRVQVSDGGKFVDLFQFSDDKQLGQIWLNSGPISLADYAGKTVRLRFHFDSIDEDRNTGKGWAVDDISITTLAPITSCADGDNNTSANAQPVLIGSTVAATICPERDIDYFRFTAQAGQPLLVDIDARTLSPASKLDSYVFLLDADGKSVIAENDDEKYAVLVDSLLSYTIQRSGTYYLKIKPWDYPRAGSPDHFYQIGLNAENETPPKSIQILYPGSNRLAPPIPFEILAQAVDFDDGPVKKVDFYWHGPDWSKPEWTLLGTDTDGSNGWSFKVDSALAANVQGAAIYVQAEGRLGGTKGAVLWDLIADRTTPVSQMNPLAGLINSTAVQLSWKASDPQDDIDRFELQYQVNSGSSWSVWQNWAERVLTGELRSTWFLGTAGYSYRFRLRAIDQAGNVEAYPEASEATTALAGTCTPDTSESLSQTLDSALSLSNGLLSQVFNFCKAGTGSDVDWIALDVEGGKDLLVIVTPRGGGAAFDVTLYNSAQQPVGNWQSADFATAVNIRLPSPSGGVYYLEIKPKPAGLSGTDTLYQVWYGPGVWFNLPSVFRQVDP